MLANLGFAVAVVALMLILFWPRRQRLNHRPEPPTLNQPSSAPWLPPTARPPRDRGELERAPEGIN
jgi:hypothetical protein